MSACKYHNFRSQDPIGGKRINHTPLKGMLKKHIKDYRGNGREARHLKPDNTEKEPIYWQKI